MLVEVDGKEVVKVVDFGIAKILPSSGKQAQNLTATGENIRQSYLHEPGAVPGLSTRRTFRHLLNRRDDVRGMTGEPPLLGENIVDTMQMHVGKRPASMNEIRPDLSSHQPWKL